MIAEWLLWLVFIGGALLVGHALSRTAFLQRTFRALVDLIKRPMQRKVRPAPMTRLEEYRARSMALDLGLPWLEKDGSVTRPGDDPTPRDVHEALHARRLEAQPDVPGGVTVDRPIEPAEWNAAIRDNLESTGQPYRRGGVIMPRPGAAAFGGMAGDDVTYHLLYGDQ